MSTYYPGIQDLLREALESPCQESFSVLARALNRNGFGFEEEGEIGRIEHTFEIQKTQITLRALTPEEELDISEKITPGDPRDFIRFKKEVLSLSICQIGNRNFRGPGKDLILMPMLNRWGRPFLDKCFQEYANIENFLVEK